LSGAAIDHGCAVGRRHARADAGRGSWTNDARNGPLEGWIGRCQLNELAWRFRDLLIYLAKGVANDPTFSATRWSDDASLFDTCS
jgi:hypothetical protein